MLARRLVYILGDAGAYSEINNLLLAHAYARMTGSRLIIDGRRWASRCSEGWQDYFDGGPVLTWPLPRLAKSRAPNDSRSRSRIAQVQILSAGRIVLLPTFWMDMRSPHVWRRAGVAEVGDRNSLFARKQEALGALYRFRPEVSHEIAAIVAAARLPVRYSAVHVRRGDKVSTGEMAVIQLSDYVDRLDFLKSDDIYVATDDHDALIEFRRLLPPGKRVHSLCPTHCSGYDQNRFNNASREACRDDMIRLFAEVEILCQADSLLCTFSSNVSRFVALRLGLEKCLSLDEDWHPW